MINNALVRTTLRREEAWELDDIAQARGIRRSHVTRAMIRFILNHHRAEFIEWLKHHDGEAVEAPIDPVPEKVAHG